MSSFLINFLRDKIKHSTEQILRESYIHKNERHSMSTRGKMLPDMQTGIYRCFLRRLFFFFILPPSIIRSKLSRIKKIIVKLTTPPFNAPVIVRTHHDFDIWLDPDTNKSLSKMIYYHGVYEEGMIDNFKKILQKGDIILDVGASIGFVSLAIANFIGPKGKVYSFEPDSKSFELLTRNIKLNNKKNIFPYQIALGEERGSAFLHQMDPQNRERGFLLPNKEEDTEKQSVQIEALEQFSLAENIQNIKLIKIDVEGAEIDVLKGASNLLKSPNAPILCIESSYFDNRKPSEVYNYILSVNRYEIYKLKRGKEIPSKLVRITEVGGLRNHDNIFCFLPTHKDKLPAHIFSKNIWKSYLNM